MTSSNPTSREHKLMSDTPGYLVIWSIPQVQVSYDDLEAIADSVGLSRDFIPRRPSGRDVWEKVTMTYNNKKVSVSDGKAQEIKAKYRVTPKLKLKVAIIKGQAGEDSKLVRHLVREVIVPTSKGEDQGGARRLVREQRQNRTAYLLTYDISQNEAEYIKVGEDPYLNGDMDTVINDMASDVDSQLNFADNQDIRNGIRKFLEYHRKVSLNTSGGAYFIPNRAGGNVKTQLEAMQDYIKALVQYRVDEDKVPSVYVFPVIPDADSFYSVSDIGMAAAGDLRKRLERLRNMAHEVSGKKGRYQEIALEKVRQEWLDIQDTARVYGSSLIETLGGLQGEFDSATLALDTISHMGINPNVVEVHTQGQDGLQELLKQAEKSEVVDMTDIPKNIMQLGGLEL